MDAFNNRLDSFRKAKRVKQLTTKRTISLKWPHPTHFVATPDTLTEAGFFFNPSWGARDNVECFCCGKCLDGWEEQDDPFAIHWDKCRDNCAWAVVRCGLSEDVDRKGNFTFKDTTRQPDSKVMEKARLATFKINDSWPHDRIRGHGANSTKMAKAGFVFTPQTPGDDTGTCLYCRVSLSGWDEDDDPLEEHQKRVKKSNLSCPFFPEAPAQKIRSRTPSLRSTARPTSRAGSKQPQPTTSETSASQSDNDSQPAPAPPRPAKRSRMTPTMPTVKEKDTSDVLRRSTRSSRAKPPSEHEEDMSGAELRRSTLGRSRNKSLAKGKGKGAIEVIEEADEDGISGTALPTKQRVKGKNVAQDAKMAKPTRKTRAFRASDAEEEAHQPRRGWRKKDTAVVDEREESTPCADSDSDVGKRRNNVGKSTSSMEESDEEIKPREVLGPRKKAKAKVPVDEAVPTPDKSDTIKKAPLNVPQAQSEETEDGNENSDEEPEQHAGQRVDPPPLFERKSGPAASSKSFEAEVSRSSGEEKTTTPLQAPTEERTEWKGSRFGGPMVSHYGHSRSQTFSGSGSSTSKSLLAKGEVKTATGPPLDDVMDVDSEVASIPSVPPSGKGDTSRKLLSTRSESESEGDVAVAPVPPSRPYRSPERPVSSILPRGESPTTPPPASSSLLSVSSATSTTKVESHTDAETLVESLPLRTNGAQLTEEERMMTVEQWIRHEIEVQYMHLRQDGEMKIRMFKERAEEVRRQIEAL